MGRYNDRIRHGTQQTRLSTNFNGVKALLFFSFLFLLKAPSTRSGADRGLRRFRGRLRYHQVWRMEAFLQAMLGVRGASSCLCNKTLEAVTTNIREQNLLGHILLENKEL